MSELSRKIQYPRRLYGVICIVLSIISIIVCFNDGDKPSQFSDIWLLPMGHLIISAFLYWFILRGDAFVDMPVLIITALLTIRNSLTPMVMALDTYRSKVGIASRIEDVRLAIAVYLLETAAIILYIVYRKGRNKTNKTIVLKTPIHLASRQLFTIVISVGLALSIASFIILPELRTQYYSILNPNFVDIVSVDVEYGIGAKRALSSASDYIITGTRLSLSAYLIYQLRKKGDNLVNFLLCMVIILAQFFLMNDSNAFIIMMVLALYLLVYKLFPSHAKKTIKYLVIVTILFAVLLYFHRIIYGAYSQSLSMWLQAYLPGINNLAVSVNLLHSNIAERVSLFFADLYAAVPFRSTLFGYSGGQMTSSLLWAQNVGALNQIMPNSFQSYYYFGFLLSPIFSVLSIKWALDMHERVQKQTNPCMYAVEVYLVLYLSIVPVMYNFYIFFKMLFSRGLFMWFFAAFYPREIEFEQLSTEVN